MGRATIAGTGIQARVDELLDAAVPYAEISARTGASLPSVGRYAISRKSELSKLVLDEPNLTTVLGRVLELNDHAQEIRRRARVSGSPVAQSRAIKSELDALSKLVAELGITDTDLAEFESESRALVAAVQRFAQSEPMHAQILLDHMAEDDSLTEFREALRGQMRNRR